MSVESNVVDQSGSLLAVRGATQIADLGCCFLNAVSLHY